MDKFLTYRNAPDASSDIYEPLHFDRVSGGVPITSLFPIFQLLPIELYHRFTQYLSSQDLAALALVDKDCLQLARSVQFCTIRNPSEWFVHHLIEEAERNEPRGIRACVRHLVFQDDQYREDTQSPLQVISSGLYHLSSVECSSVTSSIRAFSILSIALALPLTYFSLELSPTYPETLPSGPFPCPQWKLEAFVLRAYHNHPYLRYEGEFLGRIIPLLPSSLRILNWDHSPADSATLPIWPPPHFPKLTLLVGSPREIPTSVYTGGNLTQLIMDISDPLFLMHRLRIPSLKQLAWLNSKTSNPTEGCTDFIRAHPQLTCFTVAEALPDSYIERQLLPILETAHISLATLRLAFSGPTISSQALSSIARVGSLEALWLTAGVQIGIPHQWRINHAQLSGHLAPLKRLSQLVLTRDSYQTPSGQDDSWYYRIRMMPLDCDWKKYMFAASSNSDHDSDFPLTRMDAAWEIWHRDTMVDYARIYFEVLPSLELCFLGQIPIGRGENDSPVPITQRRMDEESDINILKRMFGMA